LVLIAAVKKKKSELFKSGTGVAQLLGIVKGITHPTMLARYNLRGQEASDDSGAFFICILL